MQQQALFWLVDARCVRSSGRTTAPMVTASRPMTAFRRYAQGQLTGPALASIPPAPAEQ